MPAELQSTERKPKRIVNRLFCYEVAILALLTTICIAVFEYVLIVKVRSDRAVYESVMAGTTRAEIETSYGKPRFQSRPGRPLTDAGWNGGEKETITEFGLSVYNASPFWFIICEFDENDRLNRVWMWGK